MRTTIIAAKRAPAHARRAATDVSAAVPTREGDAHRREPQPIEPIGPIGYDDSMGPLSLVVFSGLVACVPLVIGSLFLRWLGRGDCEPRRLLRTVLLFGATFGVFFGLVGSTVLSLLFPAALGRGLVLVAALLSETAIFGDDLATNADFARELGGGLVHSR
mgnify:CR=1 FL=1